MLLKKPDTGNLIVCTLQDHVDAVAPPGEKHLTKLPITGILRSKFEAYPANRRHRPNVVLMLVHRMRRWPNIHSTSRDRRQILTYKVGPHIEKVKIYA